MNINNISSWISQPDVCRCCLSTSGVMDITASYINSENVKEVFVYMIQECFGLSLSLIWEYGQSRKICELCVNQLRAAVNFRRQVTQAEDHFVKANTHKKDFTELQDTENVGLLESQDNHCDDYMEFEDEKPNITELNEHLSTDYKRVSTKKRAKTNKGTVNTNDEDSDTPIAELSKYIQNNKKSEINKDKINNKCDMEFKDIVKQIPALQKVKKQLSHRQRVIVTCNIVLRNTTACPFRHHKSWFQCFFCLQEFMEINLLRTHMESSHLDIDNELKKLKRYPNSLQLDISILNCVICQKNLANVLEMKDHFELSHKKVIYNECIADYKVNTSPFICHICLKQFHMFRSLTTHLNVHYANCICDICGKSFINTKRLKVHGKTHEKGNFPCSECGKVLKNQMSKSNHMESAHCKRQLKCHLCFAPMKHYNDRIKHMSAAHNITHKFTCRICGREYNIKHYLATHMRQTHGHKDKKCSQCGMAFITNHGLKKHMFKHSGEKPFLCKICGKSYSRNYTLREHMKIHDNVKRDDLG